MINQNTWTLYAHYFPNGIIYVGITSQSPKERWGPNGKKYKSQKIYELIQQYDWNKDIKHEILATNVSMTQASNLERQLIQYYRTINPYCISYNIADGGYNSGPCTKLVSQYGLEGNYIQTFNSMTEAAQSVNGSLSSISSCCSHKRLQAYNFQWRFEQQDKIEPLIYSDLGIPVDQFDLSGKFMKTFPNASQAEKSLDLQIASHIAECCIGRRRIAGGYQWKYHEENPYCAPLPRKKSAQIIDQYDLKNNYINTYIGLEEIQALFNLSSLPTHVLDVCHGRRKTAYGFIWKLNSQNIKNYYNYEQPVNKKDLKDNIIKSYPNIRDAEKDTPNSRKDHIYECCEGIAKTHCGYKWSYAN